MHIRFVIKKTMENIYFRKLNFLLMTIVLTVAFYLTFMVVGLYFKSNYYIYKTKASFNSDNFVNVNILMDFDDPQYMNNIGNYLTALRDNYGNEVSYFMNMPVDISVGEQSRSQNILYIKGDADIADFCLEKEIEDDDNLNCYVCRSSLKDYPIGSIIKNDYTGSSMTIVGCFETGSEWINDPLFHSQDVTFSLDDYIVSDMDEKYFEYDSDFYANLCNSIYVRPTKNSNISRTKEEIRELADENNIMIYSHTFDELADGERQSNKILMESIGILILFVVIMSVLAVGTACLADIFSRRTNIAIMFVNGCCRADIYMMTFVENILKFLIAFCIASTVYVLALGETDKYIAYNMIFPVVASGGLVSVILITIIGNSTIKQRKLLKWIGDDRL